MRTFWLSLILVSVLTIGAACDAPSTQNNHPVGDTSPTSVAPAPQGSLETPQAGSTLLLWEGPALFDENPTACHRLHLTGDNKTRLGPCDDEQTETQLLINHRQEWDQILTRFAPFQTESGRERIDFGGQGTVSGPAWERAITAWARFTYAELASGRVGAANRTVLAWNLGESPNQPGQCRRLIVLVHGYALAGTSPCQGGNTADFAGGWIDPAGWEQFDAWLYHSAPFYQNDSYLDGRGAAELSSDDAAALSTWAQTVYDQITPQKS